MRQAWKKKIADFGMNSTIAGTDLENLIALIRILF